MSNRQSSKTSSWHLAFAKLLEHNLSPLDILVFPELRVMTDSPRVDILLLRTELPNWTREQLLRLPDGVRQSHATHILLEFKFSESIDNKALIQALAYDYFYKQSKELADDEVQTFIVSAKKPQFETRKNFGYEKTRYPGVYESQRRLEQGILLISMNELTNTSYNTMFKLFATHQKERQRALEILQQNQDIISVPRELEILLTGLFLRGEEEMDYELTPEKVQEVGELLGKEFILSMFTPDEIAAIKLEKYLASISIEQRLAGIPPEQRLADIPLEQRLAGIPLEQRLADIPLEQRLAGISPEQRLAGIPLEQRLADIPPEQRLAGIPSEQCLANLPIAEIEAYLEQLKKQK